MKLLIVYGAVLGVSILVGLMGGILVRRMKKLNKKLDELKEEVDKKINEIEKLLEELE